MKLLAIDSSGLVASAAILENENLLAEYTVNFKKTHSETLLPMIDEIAKMTEQDLATLDAVAIAAGPGSFTGLRIGSATAKGLALALRVPIVEVPTLAGLAMNLFKAKGLICPVMDARRQQVYSGIYRFEGDTLVTVRDQDPVAASDLIAELNELKGGLASEGVIFLGDGSKVVKPFAEKDLKVPYTFAPANANRQRAASVGALAEVYFAEGRYVTAAEHAPIYLRKSQAEQERERKGLV